MLQFAEIAGIIPGEWLVYPPSSCAFCTAVCDDSRNLPSGALFVAIRGEITDGHKYVEAAVKVGAVGVVVEEAPSPQLLAEMKRKSCACLLVKDSLFTFQQLAKCHRMHYPQAMILAITGSCGKTSTKEMCAAILEKHYPGGVIKTTGSTNNHFGVPRNLFRIDDKTRVAVIEMGTNHPGEIANLVSLASPEVGLVSNIGHAHLEFFHDLRGVATEKGDLLAGVIPDGIAVFPQDADGVDILRQKAGMRMGLTFGATADAHVQYEYLGYSQGKFRIRLTWNLMGESRDFCWSIGGKHMAANAAAAAAATTALGCSPDEIVAGLQECRLPGARLKVTTKDGINWVNDAFNANPDSAKAAVDWFAEVAPKDSPQILVLGDMLELGEGAADAHEEVLAYAMEHCPAARIITVGSNMAIAAAKLNQENLPDAAAAAQFLTTAPDGSWILLKSSHGIHLSTLAPEE